MWAAPPLEPLKPWPRSLTSTPPPPPPPHRRSMVVLVENQNRQENGVKSKTKTNSAEKKESEEQLRGSDILMALERATSQKLSRKHERRSRDGGARDENPIGNAKIRALRIKPQWRDRLQDLESRLEQLAHAP